MTAAIFTKRGHGSLLSRSAIPLIIGASLFAAIFFGLAASFLPWWMIAPVIVLPVVLWVSFLSRPVAIFFAVLIFLLVPWFRLQDVVLAVVLVCAIYLKARENGGYFYPAWVKILAIVLAIAAVSTVLSVGFGHSTISSVYSEARVFLYWLFAFALVFALPVQNAPKMIYRMIVGVGLVIALLAVIQGGLGLALIGTGRIGALDTTGDSAAAGITRVQIAGFQFVQAALIILACEVMAEKSKANLWRMAAIVLLVLGIYYNFGRAVWVWTTFALLGAGLISGARGRLSVFVVSISLISLVAIIKIVFDPPSLDVVTQRLLSIKSEGGYGTSYGWRELENVAALRKLGETFGLGVGVGGEYRPFYIPLRNFPDHVRYIHQGHLNLMLKLSIFGWLFMMLLLLSAAWTAFARWRQSPLAQSRMLGVSITILLMLVLNNTQPLLMAYDSVLTCAFLLALIMANENGLRDGHRSDAAG